METTTLAVILLLAISTAAAANEPVIDFDGDEVRTGVEYYIVSTHMGGAGGGLALHTSSKQRCPEFVAVEEHNGMPVKFSNMDIGSDGIVRESTDVNIEFVPVRPRECNATTVWRIHDFDPFMGGWWVMGDGVKGNPGAETLTSWFKIEKAGGGGGERFLGYNFKFCPSVCDSCVILCSKIGATIDVFGNTRLVLSTDSSWLWYFKKATKTLSI